MFGSSDDNEPAAPAAPKPVVQLKKVEKSKMQQKAEAHAAKQAAAKKAASQPKPAKEVWTRRALSLSTLTSYFVRLFSR